MDGWSKAFDIPILYIIVTQDVVNFYLFTLVEKKACHFLLGSSPLNSFFDKIMFASQCEDHEVGSATEEFKLNMDCEIEIFFNIKELDIWGPL